jgi:cytochrome P450
VLKESMRLYPPVWAFGRSVTEKTELVGTPLEPGNIVFLSPYVTHRHPEFWLDPERFDPDRFLPERIAEQHRFAYFPFGGGPRICIGNTFALMEGQLVLATLAQRHRLRFVDPRPVELWPQITLRPKGELRVVAEPLNS